MAITNVITPVVADLHFDDLAQEFQLKVTFELATPAGNFRKEVRVTVNTLLAALGQISSIWAGAGFAPTDTRLAYVFGDVEAFNTALAAMTLPAHETPTFPVPIAPDETPDSDWGHYVGETDDWGATPP